MTAPVTIENTGTESVMTFKLPNRFSVEEIPVPTNPKAEIQKVDERLVASHTFSWFSGKHGSTLRRNGVIAAPRRQFFASNVYYGIAK